MSNNNVKLIFNDGKEIIVKKGAKISEVVENMPEIDNKVLAFYVNNDLKRYDAKIVKDSSITPIRLSSGDGYRIYSRTLKMILYMALTRLYSSADVKFLTTINRDQYFIIKDIKLTDEKVKTIK